MELFVSVVICSKDRHAGLEKAVAHVLEAEYPKERRDLVVVEEQGPGSKSMEGARYVSLPRLHKGLGYARNMGVQAVDLDRTDVVAFCDDDEVVDRRWLREILSPFKNPDVYGVGGLVRCQPSSAWKEAQEILGVPGGGIRRLVDDSAEEVVPTTLLSGANFAYRSAVFKEFKFPENGVLRGTAEDFLMAENVGRKYRLVFNPKAVVYHEPRPTARSHWRTFYFRQKRDYVTRRYIWGRDRFSALFWKRQNLLLGRLVIAVGIIVLAGPWSIGAMGLLYYLAALLSVRRLYRFVGKKGSFFLYPFLKAIADSAVLAGEVACLGQLRKGAKPLKV